MADFPRPNSSRRDTRVAIAHVDLVDALAQGPPPEGNLAVPIFSHGTLAVEFYSPQGHDPQRPHDRDEVYVVARGSGLFFDGSNRRPVAPGTFLFVRAGKVHRFEEFFSDLAVWVFFYGPQGGEPSAYMKARMSHSTRKTDGSAGDADYASIGTVYRNYRVADPRIAKVVHDALGDARRVLNIGAGTGSYEPTDRDVTPVEPSATMRERRPPHLPPAMDAYAERLPFSDGCFDAAMGTFTVHQWANLAAGLAEVRRVTRGPVVFLTCDPALLRTYWLSEYAPEVIETESSRYPPMSLLAAGLGGVTTTTPVPIPLDCTDGFNDAYYGRPEVLLDPSARLACSAWSFVTPEVVRRFETHLARDLADGTWDARHGHLRKQAVLDGSLVLIVSTPD